MKRRKEDRDELALISCHTCCSLMMTEITPLASKHRVYDGGQIDTSSDSPV